MKNTFLKYWSNTLWLYTMFVLGAGVLITLVLNWDSWALPQKIVAFIYILLPFHAWEEWRLPGGFGFQYNWTMGKSVRPEIAPMNKLTDMVTVFTAMCYGILLLWIGVNPAILISQAFFAFAEVAMHIFFGISMYKRFATKGKRTLYNPGFATAILVFLPILITAIICLSGMSISLFDCLIAVGLIVIFAGITFLPEKLIHTEDKAYAFEPGYYKKYM